MTMVILIRKTVMNVQVVRCGVQQIVMHLNHPLHLLLPEVTRHQVDRRLAPVSETLPEGAVAVTPLVRPLCFGSKALL